MIIPKDATPTRGEPVAARRRDRGRRRRARGADARGDDRCRRITFLFWSHVAAMASRSRVSSRASRLVSYRPLAAQARLILHEEQSSQQLCSLDKAIYHCRVLRTLPQRRPAARGKQADKPKPQKQQKAAKSSKSLRCGPARRRPRSKTVKRNTNGPADPDLQQRQSLTGKRRPGLGAHAEVQRRVLSIDLRCARRAIGRGLR